MFPAIWLVPSCPDFSIKLLYIYDHIPGVIWDTPIRMQEKGSWIQWSLRHTLHFLAETLYTFSLKLCTLSRSKIIFLARILKYLQCKMEEFENLQLIVDDSLLHSLVKYCFYHSKIKFVSSHHHVIISSMYIPSFFLLSFLYFSHIYFNPVLQTKMRNSISYMLKALESNHLILLGGHL